MDIMGKPYPKEFRDDVVRLARQGDTSFVQLAEDFGISEASIYNWMSKHRGIVAWLPRHQRARGHGGHSITPHHYHDSTDVVPVR